MGVWVCACPAERPAPASCRGSGFGGCVGVWVWEGRWGASSHFLLYTLYTLSSLCLRVSVSPWCNRPYGSGGNFWMR
jgi:hypothetical protein